MNPNRLCHSCDYNLRDLGDTGRCPECNWEFDPQSRVLLRLSRTHTVLHVIAMLMPVAGTFAMFFIHPVRESVSMIGAVICVTVAGIALLSHMRRLRVGRPVRILANAHGLRLIAAGPTDADIPWSEFGRVECRRFAGHFVILDRQGKELFRSDVGYLGGNWSNMVDLAARMNSLRDDFDRRQAEQPATPAPAPS